MELIIIFFVVFVCSVLVFAASTVSFLLLEWEKAVCNERFYSKHAPIPSIVEHRYRAETLVSGPYIYDLGRFKGNPNDFIKVIEQKHAADFGFRLLEQGWLEIKHTTDPIRPPWMKEMYMRLKVYVPETPYQNEYQHLHTLPSTKQTRSV